MNTHHHTTHVLESASPVLFLFYTDLSLLQKEFQSTQVNGVIQHLSNQKLLLNAKACTCQQSVDLNGSLTSIVFINPGLNNKSNNYRHAAATAARLVQKQQPSSVAVGFVSSPNADTLQQVAEGIVLGQYQFNQFKTTDNDMPSVDNWHFHLKTDNAIRIISHAMLCAKGQNIARDLANTPANYCTPSMVVDYTKRLAENTSLAVTVIDKNQASNKKMGAFLAVAQGSSCDPFMLELTLNPSDTPPVILVGKGVTFDTGGISLKPGKSMSDMKGDMSGAAAVIAAMKTLADVNCTQHVKAIVPLVENMPAANAYKPGDVLTAMNGKTIEVINTDAEGRLILADALCLACTYKPKLIIDIATLTGACSVALGDVASAILGNHQAYIDQCLATQPKTGEYFWQLPLYDQYKDYLKSTTADLLNCAENRLAGTATAATFLQEFVADYPWIHLDIASTMQSTKTQGFQVKGMSGVASRTLVACVESFS